MLSRVLLGVPSQILHVGKHISEALESWFSNSNRGSRRFIKKWLHHDSSDAGDTFDKAREIVILHSQRAIASEIQSTPTLFMNDMRLPPGMGFIDMILSIMPTLKQTSKMGFGRCWEVIRSSRFVAKPSGL